MSLGALIVAMILDAGLGEPKWLWSRISHPAVLMGRIIDWADRTFNDGDTRRVKGALVMIALAVGAWIMGAVLSWFGVVVEILVAAILIAQRSLVDHVADVATALRSSLAEGRASVAMIVGRDTKEMDESAVARGAIESAAENFSDGVLAPVFWVVVGGLPGLLIYKVTNTADSMIGYRTERHMEFGWAAARFDDLLNLVPARLTALIITAVYRLWAQWRGITADARQHRSPNAGWPEAAMSRALGVSLAGPRTYDGAPKDYPLVNANGRARIGPNDIEEACRALWITWGASLAIVIVLWLAGF